MKSSQGTLGISLRSHKRLGYRGQGSNSYRVYYCLTHITKAFSPSITKRIPLLEARGAQCQQGYRFSPYLLFALHSSQSQQQQRRKEGNWWRIPPPCNKPSGVFGKEGMNTLLSACPCLSVERNGEGAWGGRGVHFQCIPYLQLPHVS